MNSNCCKKETVIQNLKLDDSKNLLRLIETVLKDKNVSDKKLFFKK